jgi:CheY-like chemotaxis protein
MLRSVVGEDIEFVLETDSMPSLIRSDPGQIEQAILNLVINARDAMPSGGKLILSLASAVLDEAFTRVHPKIKPGAYLRLTVSDTGCGMDAATQARIFEPFFTTREQGKGTGLGLATVYGTIEQTGGMISVESEPEHGTRFHLYIPQMQEALAPLAPIPRDVGVIGGSETLLLVEDQNEIRSLLSQILASEGYTVLTAPNGREALLLAQNHTGPIDLMITDIVMPQMSGHELARAMKDRRPEMKILYMSGYADRSRAPAEFDPASFAYLEKPFSPDVMMREVRAILDAPEVLGRRLA